MPVVPMTSRRPSRSPVPGREPPPEPFALMAAAQMHTEGRLVEPQAAAATPEPSGGK